MNNLLSLHWLQEWVHLSVSHEELARRLSLSGAGVERVHEFGAALDKIVVGRVTAVEKHPNADALRVCRVDDGCGVRTVVCGGSNVRAGMFVALALPGSRVSWHGTGEQVEIKETELRGVKSAGMICASNEIGLGELFPATEREIMDLGALAQEVKWRAGVVLSDALHLRDTVFDIEATSNRPDLMSVVGVAREAVACSAATFLKRTSAKLPRVKQKVSITVRDKKLCPRYMAARVDGVQVGTSPLWLRQRLVRVGVRPINNIVDITNYVRIELGQPMHAFDAACVRGALTVRRSRDGEKFFALDGTQHTLRNDMLVIADDAQVCALAGIMGGAASGVTEQTTSVIFEAATFDAIAVRKAARALQLFSDSQLLFEKGLSVQAPQDALARALELMRACAGGAVTALTDARVSAYRAKKFAFDFSRVASFIGVDVPAVRMKKILSSMGFVVQGSGARAQITVPWWREHDIGGSVDFIEEIARMYGYHNIPSLVPLQQPIGRERDAILFGEADLRTFFASHGFQEAYTYSFVNEDLLTRANLFDTSVVRITNPLSSEFTVMRPSLLPSMLQVVAQNEPHALTGAVFEVSHVYLPVVNDRPQELPRVIAARWSPDASGADFFALKGTAKQLCDAWGVGDAFVRDEKKREPHLHPSRQLALVTRGVSLGVLGEIHPDILERFGIRGRVTICYLDVAALCAVRMCVKAYVPVPSFPSVKRDVAFVVSARETHGALHHTLMHAHPLLTSAELFDVYRGAELGRGKKSMAFHLEFRAQDRTLTAPEVDAAFHMIVTAAGKKHGTIVRA